MRLLSFAAAFAALNTQFPLSSLPLTPPTIRARWAEDMHSKNLQDLLTLYVPGATVTSPGQPPVTTDGELRKLYETIFATYDSTITLDTPHHHETGEPRRETSIIDEGTYRETLHTRSTGASTVQCGNYTFTYVKAPAGADGWRISSMVWTTNPCPATP